MAKKGLVSGGESTSHASGNDIKYDVVETGEEIYIEGDEYHLCKAAMLSTGIHEYVQKTNKEILDDIYTKSSCMIKEGTANTGDFIICKLAVRDKTKRNRTGTISEIISLIQAENGCKVVNESSQKKDGGGIDGVDLEFYPTTPKHAKEYGLDAKNPLYVNGLIDKKNIEYIDRYAKENGHDIIFGKITKNGDATLTKNWLHDNGYAINAENNDFHKVIQAFKDGGEIDSDTYNKWKSLVNMSKGELEKFYNSEEGKEAGLSKGAAQELGISYGRESARWIMKMKDTPVSEWTPEMWKWAKKQIGFISRMSFNKGSLYDNKGRKTRKHTSLLIWGHNPEKYSQGGEVNLLAPNGKPSNLTAEQYKLVRTPEFKAWFGDWENNPKNASKVVDENGEPLVVYHGTWEYFFIFETDKQQFKGAYFTAKETMAKAFGTPVSVFLNIRKFKNVGNGIKAIDSFERDKFIDKGIDGLVWLNKNYYYFRDYFREIVVFHPNQIKLADGSNTTFDGSNPDIRFKNGGSVLLAPNGKPSNLTPEQYKLVRTPEFKAWFGDWENDPKNASKVVDENGEPLVVYHGTINKTINIFRPISYFTENYSYAKVYGLGLQYSDEMDDDEYEKILNSGKENVYSVFLNIRNILKADRNLFSDNTEYSPKIKEAKINGFDGMLNVIPRTYIPFNKENESQFLAFYPEQIKLADGSNTTFDGSNPDIRFKEGGSVSEDKITCTNCGWSWSLADTEPHDAYVCHKCGNDNIVTNKIKGGLADKYSLADIAKKHKVSFLEIVKEHKKGIEVEMEHTSNKAIASEIAKDHIFENPNYYTLMKKIKLSNGGSIGFKVGDIVTLGNNVLELTKVGRTKADGFTANRKNYPTGLTLASMKPASQEQINKFIEEAYKPEYWGTKPQYKKIEKPTPIRELGTGAKVYFETKKIRLNEHNGKYLLNVYDSSDMLVPRWNLKFDDFQESMDIAKKISETYPTGVPEAVLLEKWIDKLKNGQTSLNPMNSFIVTKNSTPHGIDRAIRSYLVNGESEQFRKDLEIVKANPNYNTPEKFRREIVSLMTDWQEWINMQRKYLSSWVQRGGDSMADNKKYKEDMNEIDGHELLIKAANNLLKSEQTDSEKPLIVYTTAPESYDGFGTKTLEVTDYIDDKERQVRKVEIPFKNIEWQKNRYLSGNYAPFEQEKFNDIITWEYPLFKKKVMETTTTEQPVSELDRLKKELANAERLMAKPSFTGDVTPEINRMKAKIAELEGTGESLETNNPYADFLIDKIEVKFKERFPNDTFERAALVKSWLDEVERRGRDEQANAQKETIYLSYFPESERAAEFVKLQNEFKGAENRTKVNPTSAFKGFDYSYENPFALNKAIEAFLDTNQSAISSEAKQFIRRYTGYGGLGEFGASITGSGLLYEFYTPDLIIKKMWGLAYKYGYKNGSVLEPACGTGEMLKYAPKEVMIQGYEINTYSAMIAEILYPQANITKQYFEQVFIEKNNTIKGKLGGLPKYDLVMMNPPYGAISSKDSKYLPMGEQEYTKAVTYAEYFITRGLDLLEDGGLMVAIVGAELKNGGKLFLDGKVTKAKQEIAEKSELLDAYRLPSKIFERTGVTSEIIVLKKV